MANIHKFQQAIRVGKKAADPSAETGVIYYNTTDNAFKFRDNSTYKTIADRSFLSSTSAGQGASQIGIQDAGGNYTATTVEAALAEVYTLANAGGSSVFADNLFRVQDNGDATKQLAVELAGATAATTTTLVSSQSANRSLTLPNATDNLVAEAFAQSLTNKTIVAASNTITTAASGNLAAVELNAALAELQSDIDTRALSSVVTEIDANVDDLITLSGVAENATHLGTFTGITIADSSTNKAALQSLETAVELRALDSVVIKKDGSVAFTAAQSMGGFKLTSLADGTAASDAINKGQLDSALNGLKPKAAVRAASTANVVIASELENGDSLDGVTLATGDRVLLKDQSTASQNGIYVVVASGTASRSLDFDSVSPIDEINGAMVPVEEGTANAGKIFVQSGAAVVTVGTDAINFVFFNSVSNLVGGDGITISGLNVSVDHDGEGLQFVSTQLALELDGSTLSKSASGLKVATGGINNNEVNAAAAIAYSKLALSNSIVNADVNASAAISYSKLALSNSIVNADVNASAAISYSKLALSNSIVNADINASAAIDASKIADGSVSSAEFQFINSLSSNAQTQLDARVVGPASATDNAIARFDATTGKLIQNSTSALDDLGGLTIADMFKRGDSSLSVFVEEEYKDGLSLTASTTAVLAGLTYDSAVYSGMEISYTVRNGNDWRIGTLRIVNNNLDTVNSTVVDVTDEFNETADISLEWSAAINAGNIEISYTTGAGTYVLNGDCKRFYK